MSLEAQVIAAAVRGTPISRKRLSAYVYMDGLLYYLNNNDVLPRGITILTPAVRDYACKAGLALRKLAACLLEFTNPREGGYRALGLEVFGFWGLGGLGQITSRL